MELYSSSSFTSIGEGFTCIYIHLNNGRYADRSLVFFFAYIIGSFELSTLILLRYLVF